MKTSTFIPINFGQVVQPRSALVVVDVQNDFISGSLASPGAAEVMIVILTILLILIPEVIGPINTMVDRASFTQLWLFASDAKDLSDQTASKVFRFFAY